MVVYYRGRRPVRTFFSSREQAELRAAELRKVFRTGMNPEDVARAARLAGGTGYAIAALVELGLQSITTTGATTVSPTMTFAEAADAVMQRAITRQRRPATISGYKYAYSLLKRTFGSRCITMITESEVDRFIRSKKDKGGKEGNAKTWTRISAIRLIKTAMRAAGVTNPLPRLIVPVVGPQAVQYFTVAEVRKLLRAAEPDERGALALLLFAALRPTLISRLPANCVDSHARTITIPDHLAKDRVGHTLEGEYRREDGLWRPGLPAILWVWLEAFPYQPTPWAPLQHRLKKALGGRWIHDGTRHTGATYYNAIFGKDATKTLLTHETPMMAVRHYIGQASRADSLAFYALDPSDFQGSFPAEWKAKTVNWPPDPELAAWVQREPSTVIAKKLGCSDVAVWKRCRTRGIPKPGPGAWQRELLNSG